MLRRTTTAAKGPSRSGLTHTTLATRLGNEILGAPERTVSGIPPTPRPPTSGPAPHPQSPVCAFVPPGGVCPPCPPRIVGAEGLERRWSTTPTRTVFADPPTLF